MCPQGCGGSSPPFGTIFIRPARVGIRNRKDFYSGLLFFAFGLLAVLIARDYPLGSLLRMGPGYFPTLLGATLAGLGIILMGRSFFMAAEAVRPLALRPLAFVLLSLLLFAVMLRPLGLVLSTLTLVVTSALGSRESRRVETVLLAVGLTTVAVALFYYGLRLPFDVWPQ